MKRDYTAQAKELRDQARELSDGPSKVALLEEAVRLADAHQDKELGFALREDLIRAATFGGYPEKSLVAFTWRLAMCDREPERFDEDEVLWEYKWIADSLGDFPQISRQQIEDMLEDMTRRYQRQGGSLRSIHKLRCMLAMQMQEKAAARKHHAAWKKSRWDWNSDCPACDQNHQVKFQIFTGHDEKALELARPILAGSMKCAQIPHATLALVLVPLVRLGRTGEAMVLHHRGYRLISGNRKMLEEAAAHLTFLALTDNLPKAVKLFEKHLHWSLETAEMEGRFKFDNAVRFLLARVAERGQTTLRLRLPRTFPAYQEAGCYEVAVLRQWFDQSCQNLAARFDARNGNDGFTKLLEGPRKLTKLVTPCPLQPKRKKGASDE
jgi:hypothetical protein